MLTIVAYHYVRPLKNSPYPEIKGLELDLFKEQLAYIEKYYVVVRMEEVFAAVQGRTILPRNALLLTFDDGYRDHYEHVFPLLLERGWQGSFFPVLKATLGEEVLNVNRIHFLLAVVEEKEILVKEILDFVETSREEYDLETGQSYYSRLAKPNRWDSGDVIFIKRMLQRELPEELRTELAKRLFARFFSEGERVFARKLYLSMDQLKEMRAAGMFIGSHGYNHFWLNSLSPQSQEDEIEESLAFLTSLGCSKQNWVMCYPFGAYDDVTLRILKERGCVLGLTTEIGIVDIDSCDPFVLPRLDTNDLPKDASALPNEWTKKILG